MKDDETGADASTDDRNSRSTSSTSPSVPGESQVRRCGFATLFGRSNVGKSTLLNRLVGHKVSIVTSVPQTTRRKIQGVRTFAGSQVIYMDTPGVHKPRYALNRRMVSSAVGALDGMDLLLLMIDGSAGVGPGDRFVMDLAARRTEPVFLVVNKIDLMSRQRILALIAQVTAERSFTEVIPVSAETGDNVDRLESLIAAALPEREWLFPPTEVTDAPEQFLTEELLREQLILHTREELPHSTAVVLERYEESENGVLAIDALVLVERDSQKGILIGRGGETLKSIATAARREMEVLLKTRVMLRVWVKVAQKWRMDPRVLDRLGVDEGPGVHLDGWPVDADTRKGHSRRNGPGGGKSGRRGSGRPPSRRRSRGGR